MLTVLLIAVGLLLESSLAQAHQNHAHHEKRLPTIGTAPDFSLIAQDGRQVTFQSLRGKVVAVNFFFTGCTDVCSMLTDRMSEVQDALGADFGSSIAFVSITIDPERDTPDVLKRYAEAFGADPAGWRFLTGTPVAIQKVASHYGVVAIPASGGKVDHNLLTTLIDRHGIMRVQYLGYQFDEEEFRLDLLDLVNEP